jgi:hypothetical protein
VNIAARLESPAPAGGIAPCIGAHERQPAGCKPPASLTA